MERGANGQGTVHTFFLTFALIAQGGELLLRRWRVVYGSGGGRCNRWQSHQRPAVDTAARLCGCQVCFADWREERIHVLDLGCLELLRKLAAGIAHGVFQFVR